MYCQLIHKADDSNATESERGRRRGGRGANENDSGKIDFEVRLHGGMRDLWMDCAATHRVYYTAACSSTFFVILCSI